MKLFFMTAAAILHTAYTACDSGWIEHGNSCYKFTTDVQNWVGARSMCKFHGADLAMAETQSENEWIKTEARRANHTAPEEGFWLGATDFIEEGHWYWESTRPIEFTYTDWGHLEPNNRFDRQHCLAILKFFDYHWGDEKCDWDNLNYVCEKGSTTGINSIL